jgi:hypothetical protein
VTRSLLRRASDARFVFFAVLCILLVHSGAAAQERESLTIVGRLATVEPANRRVTVVPVDAVNVVELFLAEDGAVEQDKRTLSLTELVIQVGRRVTVTYRVDGDRRLAESIIVEPE